MDGMYQDCECCRKGRRYLRDGLCGPCGDAKERRREAAQPPAVTHCEDCTALTTKFRLTLAAHYQRSQAILVVCDRHKDAL